MSVQSFFNAGGSPPPRVYDSPDSMDDFIVPDDVVEYMDDADEEMHEAESPPLSRPYRFRKSTLENGAAKRKRRIESSDDEDFVRHRPKKARTTQSRDRRFRWDVECLTQMGRTEGTIVGRDVEVRQVTAMLQQPSGGIRPLLLGARGIGKASIIEKVARQYLSGAGSLEKRKIYCLDCGELIAQNMSDNLTEEVGLQLREVMDKVFKGGDSNSILYMRDIEKLLALDTVSEYVLSVLKKPVHVIASISEDAKEEKTAKAIAQLARYNFSQMQIKESSIEEVKAIVSQQLQGSDFITYTDAGVDLGVRLAAKHFTGRPMPVRALNVIQECANTAFLREGGEVEVTEEEVARFVSSKKGIPSEDLLDHSVFNEQRFVERLSKQIVGQKHAIKVVGERVATWKMGLLSPHKPWGVFLFVGPTGVGKTELAKQLAKQLFHNEENLIILDGSEYKEDHTASNLVGAPRGYEGHDSGGMLTGPLLENPYQVVLFDEFEKAHDDVRKLFLQVFDQGRLTDRRGKVADCTKALFIMTSNLGSKELFGADLDRDLDPATLISEVTPILVENLSPELCGRFTGIVPFQPIRQEILPQLVEVQLLRKKQILAAQTAIDLCWTPELVEHLTHIDVDLRFGARIFCNTVNEAVERVLKEAFTSRAERLSGKVELVVSHEGKIVVNAA